jgi:rSAM/selenodomain-associated transferase 1
MPRTTADVAVAVLAKAPIPGLVKTRLVPVLGEEGAAELYRRLLLHAVACAASAGIGPVTLWGAPDASHPAFHALAARFGISLASQPDGDLGARMLAAIAAAQGPVLVIGSDCPALTAQHLRSAADALRAADVVIVPAQDGGYALIGMQRPHRALFSHMTWSAPTVMEETRARLRRLGLVWREMATVWDVDTPADLVRLRESGLLAEPAAN